MSDETIKNMTPGTPCTPGPDAADPVATTQGVTTDSTGTGNVGTGNVGTGSPAMPAEDTLWVLKHGEDVYGPYTTETMQGYIDEGRIAAHSVIAPATTEQWAMAGNVPFFAARFMTQAGSAMSRPPVSYGPEKGQVERREKPPANNFVVITDIQSHHTPDFERALMSTGPALKISSNAWIVSTNNTAPGLINLLSQHISNADKIFIADSTSDKIAWFNHGPRIDSRARRVWQRRG